MLATTYDMRRRKRPRKSPSVILWHLSARFSNGSSFPPQRPIEQKKINILAKNKIATISYTIKKENARSSIRVFAHTREVIFPHLDIGTFQSHDPRSLSLTLTPAEEKREQFMDNKIPLMDATRPEFIHPPFPLALLSHKFGNYVMGWAFRSNCTRGRK